MLVLLRAGKAGGRIEQAESPEHREECADGDAGGAGLDGVEGFAGDLAGLCEDLARYVL